LRHVETSYHQQRCHDVVRHSLRDTRLNSNHCRLFWKIHVYEGRSHQRRNNQPKRNKHGKIGEIKTYILTNGELENCELIFSGKMRSSCKPFKRVQVFLVVKFPVFNSEDIHANYHFTHTIAISDIALF
jgi:hypothetical protein